MLSDAKGRRLDVHSYTFDEDGHNIQGIEYEPRDLHGLGVIGHQPVKCITPQSLVKFHTGRSASVTWPIQWY